MDKKIVRTLKLPDSEDEYQINAVKFDGKTPQEFKESVTTDDVQAGQNVWIFDCGTSTVNID